MAASATHHNFMASASAPSAASSQPRSALLLFGMANGVYAATGPFPQWACESEQSPLQSECVWVSVAGTVKGVEVTAQGCSPLQELRAEHKGEMAQATAMGHFDSFYDCKVCTMLTLHPSVMPQSF